MTPRASQPVSCSLLASEECDVDKEGNEQSNNNPSVDRGLALSVFAFPKGTQEVHRLLVAEPECSKQDELLLCFFGLFLRAAFELQCAAFHL